MDNHKFEEAYERLNEKQREAVDTIEGPVMVIAGPGTGKTQILTLRIANILKKTQTDPSSILALTFTDSGVKAMKERLVEFIGSTGYKADIFTFHSFCKKIIDENPECFPFSEDSQILSDLERIEIFKEILDENEFIHLKPKNTPYYNIKNFVERISDLKKEGITPEIFKQIVIDEENNLNPDDFISTRTKKPKKEYYDKLKSIEKWKELIQIYSIYNDKLQDKKRFDYDDIINFVTNAFSNDEELLAQYQEKYLYILADEYQDTNSAQNEVIRLLTSFDVIENPNVFIVGDDEQSIYRFQGASMENFQFFEKTYPQTKKITLITNYRSTQNILDASRSIVELNKNKIESVDRSLQSFQNYENRKLNLVKTTHEIVEKYFIAKKIKELISKGVSPSQIAVIYKKNLEGYDLAEALGKFGIKTQSVKGENVLDDLGIKKLIKILQVIFETEDELKKEINDNFFWTGERFDKDVNLFTILHYPNWQITETDILKLVKFASDQKKHLCDVLNEKSYLIQIELENGEKIAEFWNKINKWKADSINQPFAKFLEIVIRESGLLEQFLNSGDKIDKLNKLNKFFDEIKKFNYSKRNLNLTDFFNTLSLRQENNISIPVNDLKRDDDSVQLMTAHSSKGLEFEYVFIYKCVDTVWGNLRDRGSLNLPEGIIKYSDITKIEKNEDERRLFYVAMTRAKKELFITYANNYSSNGESREFLPSSFISEINNNFIEYLDASEYENNLETALETLTVGRLDLVKISTTEEEFLKNIVKHLTVSPTGLNTYLKCPYKFKLDRLFLIPKIRERPLAFGTSIHKALEDFFRTYANTGSYPDFELAINSFKKELERQLLSKKDFDDLILRGPQILKDYLSEVIKNKIDVLGTEYNFGSRNVYFEGTKLTGKVDRIDFIDRDRKEVEVIDYKTGHAKSMNEILGKTKNSDLDYKRQLVFYKLLSQLDTTFNKNVISTKLEFVESDGGKFKSINYQVTEDDLIDLKNTIRNVIDRIKKLEFERTTEYKHCENCQYREHCWPDKVPDSSDNLANS